ncbi:hypothetical protein [Fodinicola feengrottensis]|uniref:hypothetical protein n=1 Tax=Fodinicola feengrottensis TaxID=435914 RepID=UPI0024416D4B|nr:hypothetical protein [Fodinicola feengrottensis]
MGFPSWRCPPNAVWTRSGGSHAKDHCSYAHDQRVAGTSVRRRDRGKCRAGARAAQRSAAGINAISGNWARDLQADDGPNFDQLTVKKNGSIRLGGQPDNLYDCTGSVRATGNNHYLFSLRCLSAGEVYYQKAKAEYSPKHRALTIHMGRTETFHR